MYGLRHLVVKGLNVFTSHVIPSHHTKRFYITPPLTSNHSTQHTTYHMFHDTSRRHFSNVATYDASDHHSPYLTSHYTAISHHHISKPQSTFHTISHPELFYTTPTFNISTFHTTLHHHIWHRNTLLLFFSPPLTSRNNRTTHCMCHILHHHISHIVTFHSLHYATFHWHHAIFHVTFCIQSHSTMSKITTFHINHISHRTIIRIKSRSTKYRHTIPHHAHIPPRHAHHHVQI